MAETMVETMQQRVARAVREEILRQYRDDERRKCPAGAAYYEEHISPDYIARAAIEAMREPTDEMLSHPSHDAAMWEHMIDAALSRPT